MDEENVHIIGLERKAEINEYRKWVLSLFEEYVEGDILEVGCGKAMLAPRLLERGTSYTGVDLSDSLLEEARDHFGDHARISLREFDVTSPAFDEFVENNSFQTVISLNTLEHLEDDREAINQFHRALGDGGRVIIQIPALPGLYGTNDEAIGHVRRYNEEMLEELFHNAGLEVESMQYMNLLGIIPWWIQGHLLEQRRGYFDALSDWQITLNNYLSLVLKTVESIVPPPVGISLFAISRPK